MLDQLGVLVILQSAETAHNPTHSPHIVKSVRQVLETCEIVESFKTQLPADHSLTEVFEQLASDGASSLALFLITFQPGQNYLPFFETLGSINKLVKEGISQDACHHTEALHANAKYYQNILQDHLACLKFQPNMTTVENLSWIQISKGKKNSADGQRPTTLLGREQPLTSTRFSDSNPFRKQTRKSSANLHTLQSQEWVSQQGIGTPSSHMPYLTPPNIYKPPLMQQSPIFLPPSGYTYPAFQPLQQSFPNQLLPFGGWSYTESSNDAAIFNADFRTREQVESLTPWSTPPHLDPQSPSTAHIFGGHPLGLRGSNYPWPHGGSPAPFQYPQPTFSPGRGPIILGNQNTIHFTCHNHDSGNTTTTRMTDSANNSSSRISGNTGTFPPF